MAKVSRTQIITTRLPVATAALCTRPLAHAKTLPYSSKEHHLISILTPLDLELITIYNSTVLRRPGLELGGNWLLEEPNNKSQTQSGGLVSHAMPLELVFKSGKIATPISNKAFLLPPPSPLFPSHSPLLLSPSTSTLTEGVDKLPSSTAQHTSQCRATLKTEVGRR